mmetsp:Transcript_51077/g.94483  ORF Transcript_51077/g.94483 Transcript_51077/m.94483 type:complete len:290 (+) Transcript_51077:55-924(+)
MAMFYVCSNGAALIQAVPPADASHRRATVRLPLQDWSGRTPALVIGVVASCRCIHRKRRPLIAGVSTARRRLHASALADGESIQTQEPDVQELEQQLQAAISSEDYIEAARLRDEIYALGLSGEAGMMAAHSDLVAAQQARSISKMAALWLPADHSCCIHLAQLPTFSYDAILESWRRAFEDRASAKVDPSLQSITVRGAIGRIVAVDEKAKTVTTSFFERTSDGWKLWNHHVGALKPQDVPKEKRGLVRHLPRWLKTAAEAVKKRITLKRQQKELQPQTVRELQTIGV